MTPEREAYLAKCSYKERKLRELIAEEKQVIKRFKERQKYPNKFLRSVQLLLIKRSKIALSALRHELQRLKGMDNVVVPKVSYTSERSGQFLLRHEHCCCGNELYGELYCPECGKRVLWEKVK
jgi:hypothetical protein